MRDITINIGDLVWLNNGRFPFVVTSENKKGRYTVHGERLLDKKFRLRNGGQSDKYGIFIPSNLDGIQKVIQKEKYSLQDIQACDRIYITK